METKMDSTRAREGNSSIPADVEPVRDEHCIHPDHISDPSCWCHPIEVEPGLWLHNEYVSDLRGAIQGDDGARNMDATRSK
jgi:hypothetical protein